MGLCLGPDVFNWALIRLRGEKKPEAPDSERHGHVEVFWDVV